MKTESESETGHAVTILGSTSTLSESTKYRQENVVTCWEFFLQVMKLSWNFF